MTPAILSASFSGSGRLRWMTYASVQPSRNSVTKYGRLFAESSTGMNRSSIEPQSVEQMRSSRWKRPNEAGSFCTL